MTSWHVDEMVLRRWIDRTDALPHSASVEQHLLACEQCRGRVRIAVGDDSPQQLPDLDAVWARVRDAVEVPRSSWFEQMLARLGCRPTMRGWLLRPGRFAVRG